MTQNYKRIAKNTGFLYIRMLIIMGVSFYTVRIVLDTLGVSDFGIYNLVASFVMILALLSNTLTSGTQRFLTFEIGKNDLVKLKQIFSTALLIHIALAVIILILAETIGLWFLYEKINIPVDRLDAAFWVYQFSILSVMVTITQVPYNALIIAHERMQIFAYISIIEAILKLFIVYMLLIVSYDKLITYSILMFAVSLVIAIFYRVYTLRNYKESHFEFSFDKEIVKAMVVFSGWNLFGTIGALVSSSGIAILLNIFFGPIANAAYAISMQVSSALNQFVNNFQVAMTPNITKLYAQNKIDELNNFLLQNSKYAFLLLWVIVLPILFKLDYILSIWLTTVPQNTEIFTKLLIIYGLMYALLKPLVMAIHATGKNKGIQLTAGTLLILVLPISYLLLKFDFPIYSPLIVSLVIWFFHLSLEFYFLKKYINFSVALYLKKTIIPILLIVLISSIITSYLSIILDKGLFHVFLFSCITLLLNLVLVYFIAFDNGMRQSAKVKIVNIYNLTKDKV